MDLVQLPFLDPTHVDRTKRAAIMLGQSPEGPERHERDRP